MNYTGAGTGPDCIWLSIQCATIAGTLPVRQKWSPPRHHPTPLQV